MALIKCVECKKDLSFTTDACTGCGSKKPFKGVVLSPKEQKGMTYKERKIFIKSGGKLKHSFLTKIGMLVFICILAFIFLKPSTPLTAEQKAIEAKEQLENSARYACQYQLEKRLFVPDSVDYLNEMLDRIVIDKGNGDWFVQLNYKSKNKLGVMIKNQVQCDVIYKLDKFTVVSLSNN